jgi:ornithine cyclodeaminase/alanine dehydrogenase-like protein (mu-crystallin family)
MASWVRGDGGDPPSESAGEEGEVQLPWLGEAELRSRLSMPVAIEAMRSAFAQLSDGRARIPVRTGVEGDGTLALFMPGWLPAEGALEGC